MGLLDGASDMGRKLRSSDVIAILEASIQQSLALTDLSKLSVTGAYLSMALSALADECRKSPPNRGGLEARIESELRAKIQAHSIEIDKMIAV